MAFFNCVSKSNLYFIFLLFIFVFTITTTEAQVVSYGMRKLALSMNQFGLDMLRTIDRMDRVLNATTTTASKSTNQGFGFCPFCVGSSLAMILAGLKDDGDSFKQGEGKPKLLLMILKLKRFLIRSIDHLQPRPPYYRL